MAEVELKFLLNDAAAARALAAGPAVRALSRGPAAKANLRSIYFDVEDQALRRAGIALRLRRSGRSWLQTVKRGGGPATGGFFALEEWEGPAPGGRLDLGAIADDGLREAVLEALGGRPPAPVFETRIRRTLRDLETALGRVEMAIDVGEIVAGDRAEPLFEAELELKEGAPDVLYDAAREVLAHGAWRFSERSKAARGFALAAGEPAVPPPAVRRAASVDLAPNEPSEAAAARVLRECLAQIDANAAVALASDAPEGPHQLRVGLRRLRSAFGLFRDVLGGEICADLNMRARGLAALVGRLRDLDVQVTEVLRPAVEGEGPDRAGFAALSAALEARRAATRAEVREALEGPATRLLLLDLSAFVELRGWLRPADHAQTERLARPAAELGRAALERRWRKVRRAARDLPTLDDEGRHALRKELKKLRYGVEFLSPAFPRKRARRFAKRLKRLQTAFGALNDAAVAEAIFAGPDAPCARDPLAQRAAGRLLGRLEAAAARDRAAAETGWAALEAEGPFWR